MKQEKWEGRAKLEHLYELLEKIDTFYCFDEIDSKKLTALKIAFEEMFVNVTKYAYPKEKDAPKTVTVTLEWLDGEARIQLTDHGIPYNPLCKEDPDLSADVMQRPIGGLGIHMVKKMTDDLQYSCQNGENQITLIKKLI